jgi:hypothetical protein
MKIKTEKKINIEKNTEWTWSVKVLHYYTKKMALKNFNYTQM